MKLVLAVLSMCYANVPLCETHQVQIEERYCSIGEIKGKALQSTIFSEAWVDIKMSLICKRG